MKINYSDFKNIVRKQHFDDIANKLLNDTKEVDFFIFNLYIQKSNNLSVESEMEEINVFISNNIRYI